ncbi:hypothetical protein [Pseudonocardia oceani]|nr:hypothetical protein [Pseudonocardia oceani]
MVNRRGGAAANDVSPAAAGPSAEQETEIRGGSTGRVASINEMHHALGAAAQRGGGRRLSVVDVDDAVHAAAGAAADPGPDAEYDAQSVAEQIGRASAHMARLGLPGDARRPADFAGFGMVIPVLAGSPGAGASALAAALADALQLAGRRVLLVDAADPARSGLSAAAAMDGPWVRHVGAGVSVRYSWREQALLARLESSGPITPGMVPPPPWWRPRLDGIHATVADLGHDGWRVAANPLVGAGGWLRRSTGSTPGAVLVVRPTRPSLRHAEQVLARLDRWVDAGAAMPAAHLVVTGARRWPAGVTGVAGLRVEELLPTAVFVPHDAVLEVGGVTAELVGDKVLDAVVPLLSSWGLLPSVQSTQRSWSRRRGNR